MKLREAADILISTDDQQVRRTLTAAGYTDEDIALLLAASADISCES
jgi:hypothetical protein